MIKLIASLSSILLVAGTLLLSPYYYQLSPLHTKVTKAVAVIHPTKDKSATGKVTFTQEKDGIRIVAKITGLTPGKHGFHIHEFGDCGCPDAQCAGAHYNPTNQPHAGPNNAHRHVGDLGNIIANEQGEGTLELLDTQIQFNGQHSIIGRSVIIHAQEDDLMSQPSGNAGDRIGCGNIGIAQ
jgi:Cu-Zn family superoxide dismutase